MELRVEFQLLVLALRATAAIHVPSGCSSFLSEVSALHRINGPMNLPIHMPLIGRRFILPAINLTGYNFTGFHLPAWNLTGLYTAIRTSLYAGIQNTLPASKELHSTCRIDVNKASSADLDFLRALKDKHQLCFVCTGVHEDSCNTVGICAKGSSCYKGHDLDHQASSKVAIDPYTKPAALTFGCCDPRQSNCRSYSHHSITAASPYKNKANYTMSVCTGLVCNAYTHAQYSSLYHSLMDGHWSSWARWSSCSVSCGGSGHQTRARTCTNPAPSGGGSTCTGSGSDSRTCRVECPVAGHWASWGHWTSCSVSCGRTGHQTRIRTCTNPAPAHGGPTCSGSSSGTTSCLIHCPVAGHWTSWGSYSSCSGSCGHSGHHTKHRTCTNPAPKYGGANCTGSTSYTRFCLTSCPPVNGHWAAWSHWSSCSVSCGTGHRTARRTCTHPAPAHGGATCSGSSTTSATCSSGTCPVDGGWGHWSSYGACSTSCCTGSQSRTRACDHPSPAHGGKSCTVTGSTSTRTCTNSCKGDQSWSGWGHWSSCSLTCGPGTKHRTRTCANQTSCTGDCGSHNTDTSSCNERSCPVDGHWGHWSSYGACSVTCCTGNMTRTRLCDAPAPTYGGRDCGDASTQTKTCSNSCMGDAHWSSWSTYSDCSVSCSTGSKTRTRSCTNQTSCTGSCLGHATDTATCGAGHCPVNGSWSAWTSYSPCSVSCCSGDKTRTRHCNHPSPSHGGLTCPGKAKEISTCSNPCRGDATWSPWGHWSACSVSCEAGTASRTRTCTNKSTCTGPCAGNTTVTKSCDDGKCPVWSSWFYGACSVTCGTGSKQGMRRCSSGRDVDCSGSATIQTSCSEGSCPVNGGWGAWQAWGSCSETCGSGTMTRSRSCDNPKPAHGGATCTGQNTLTEACSITSCPQDGGWGQWSSYSACSVTCCKGLSHRTRTCDNPKPALGGRACPGVARENEECSNPCTGDALWSDWQGWGSCSLTCNAGTKSRTRACSNQSTCTGPCSGNATTTITCDQGVCPGWSTWFFSSCSVTCGAGTKQGVRRCSSGHEEDCSGLSMTTEKCNDTPCPVDGGWGDWHSWGSCSRTCGDGTRSRQRVCDSPTPAFGGSVCHGNVSETGNCNVKQCPHWGAYYEVGSCSVTCGQGSVQLQRDCSTGNSHDCTGSPYDERACSLPGC